jgi:hypothetical protein
MWRRKTTGVVALAFGIVLLVAAIADHAFAAPKAALCQSDIGQVGQAFDGTVAHDCGLVTTLESAVGWLVVTAALALVLGALVLYNSRAGAPGTPSLPGTLPPSATPQFPGAPSASHYPAAPTGPPSSAPEPPANPPWWQQP